MRGFSRIVRLLLGSLILSVPASIAAQPLPADAQAFSNDALPETSQSTVDGRPEEQSPAGEAPLEPNVFFVLGNVEFILLHELAHVMIADFEIPIVGPEEGAADYIATAALIRAEEFNVERVDRARQFLLATASGLATAWDFSSGAGADIQYWDTHTLTIQRFYQIICLIYGSNQAGFATLPERVGMPEGRASRCPREFERAMRGLRWLLDNHGRAPGDPPGAEIDIVFEPAPSRASQQVANAIAASGVIDDTVARLHEQFTITMPFRIVFRRCGQPQAAWVPEDRDIVLCYELLDSYYALGRTTSADRRRQQLDAP
jgi:hypothetical protein